jgi:CheY-like chemotaxis protein
VVEDDPDIQALFQHHLERLGCDATLVSTGREALAVARLLAPDLVFVDMMLPDMLGNDVVERLRADPLTADCRIVVASALDPELHGLDADEQLPKPFTRHDLEAVLNRQTA